MSSHATAITDQARIEAILEDARTIAVVGASSDPEKAAHRIPKMLLELGYQVIPVHPRAEEILGQKVYPTLAEVPVPIDIVDVFRPAEEAPELATQAVAVGAAVIWLQKGLKSVEAAAIAEAGGVGYVEDLCLGATAKGFRKGSAQ